LNDCDVTATLDSYSAGNATARSVAQRAPASSRSHFWRAWSGPVMSAPLADPGVGPACLVGGFRALRPPTGASSEVISMRTGEGADTGPRAGSLKSHAARSASMDNARYRAARRPRLPGCTRPAVTTLTSWPGLSVHDVGDDASHVVRHVFKNRPHSMFGGLVPCSSSPHGLLLLAGPIRRFSMSIAEMCRTRRPR